jgi:hypothetical protein
MDRELQVHLAQVTAGKFPTPVTKAEVDRIEAWCRLRQCLLNSEDERLHRIAD